MPDELILFEKMQRGDTSALEYFFREYTDMLYYRAFGFVKDNFDELYFYSVTHCMIPSTVFRI